MKKLAVMATAAKTDGENRKLIIAEQGRKFVGFMRAG